MANSITIPGEFKALLKQLHSMGLLSLNFLVLFTQNRNDTFFYTSLDFGLNSVSDFVKH